MIKPEVLDAMVAAGCTGEQIAAAVKADQAGSSGAERQARYRAKKASQNDERNVTTVTVTDTPPSPKEIPQTPLEITPYPQTPSPPKGGSFPAEFETRFWPMYPHKVGKPEAARKFAAARKLASLETIMDGLGRYVAKTDDRPWCNPATWLHQQRWADEPATVARGSPSGDGARAPSQADVFAAVGRSFQNGSGSEYEDSRSSRQAIPYLRTVEQKR